MHGDEPDRVRAKIDEMEARRRDARLPRMVYGVAGYSLVRREASELARELARITDVRAGSPGYQNYQDWLANTQLEQRVSLEDYSVSNRGLRAGLVGSPWQVQDQVLAFERAGVDLLLLQCSPQLEEMERFAEEVIAPLRAR
jgi:FMNH2-dependent dimethyl sulfone monooxygenase